MGTPFRTLLGPLSNTVDAFGPQMADFQAKEELVATELAKAEQELESAKEDLVVLEVQHSLVWIHMWEVGCPSCI